ncbi:MAG TPA: FliM/FliN family flagellar motor switch protein [Bryobacteraceae bacterium]|nr:FliM/FliN family flagellar motor switch protein [Bryobacteraceae bacterium]
MDSNRTNPGPRAAEPAGQWQDYVPGSLATEQTSFAAGRIEKFLETFAASLASRLETPAASQIGASRTVSESAYLKSVENGSCPVVLDADPVGGQIAVTLSFGLTAFLLRALLCAPSAPAGDPRPVTDIERHILRDVFDSVAKEMSAAWNPAGIAFRWNAAAREPAPGQGAILVFECFLSLGDVRGALFVAIPTFLARLSVLRAGSSSPEEPAPSPREAILNAMRGAKVNVEAALSGAALRMEDLLALQPGDVVMLPQSAGAPVECRIGGVPKFAAELVTRGGRHALLLQDARSLQSLGAMCQSSRMQSSI